MTRARLLGAGLSIVGVGFAMMWLFYAPPETYEGASTTVGADSVGAALASEPGSGCSHQYLPVDTGAELVYRWESATRTGALSFVARDSSPTLSGAVVTWVVRTTGLEPSVVGSFERPCDADGSSEYWVGLGTGGPVVLVGQDWRLPSSLDVGVSYGGTLQLDVGGARVRLERQHRVTSRERLSVPAGTYDALRIEVTDSADEAATPTTSVLWIAPGVGLVRAVVGEEPMAIAYELVSMGRQPRGPGTSPE